jgi:hypothetical protein
VPASKRTATTNAARSAAALAKLRASCLALPDVTERPSHGMPAWFVGKRIGIEQPVEDYARISAMRIESLGEVWAEFPRPRSEVPFMSTIRTPQGSYT